MSSIQELYNKLFSGSTIVVACESARDYNTLRTALCKKNVLPVALEMTELSVCGSYNAQAKLATFKLGESARKKAAGRWHIVSEEDAP